MATKRPASSPVIIFSTAKKAKLSEKEWNKILHKQHYIFDVAFTAEDGDLTVVIIGGDPDDIPVWQQDTRIALTVQSSKLDRALPGWRSQIAQTECSKLSGHLPVAEFAIGTPRVLRYFIIAAHQKDPTASTSMADYDLTLRELRDVSILSHKFDALHLISGNISGWVDVHFPFGWQLKESEDEEDCDQLNYLWIAYEFGLHGVFHQMCFNLAFVSGMVFSNPNTMPPGIYEEIYKARVAYTASLVSEISSYSEALLNAIAPEAQVPDYICSHESQGKACATQQLKSLDEWIKNEDLDISAEHSHWISQGRSPLSFFRSVLSTGGIRNLHGRRYTENCGLILLTRRIEGDGMTRLLKWMTKTRACAQLATEAHVSYMKQQREKLGKQFPTESIVDWP